MTEVNLTAQDWLEALDRGDIVTTIDMGGMGPGYELALQGAAVAIVRGFLPKMPLPGDEAWWGEWGETHRDELVKQAIAENPRLRGLSGAQVGAATNLAFNLLHRGVASFDELPKDRLILLHKGDLEDPE